MKDNPGKTFLPSGAVRARKGADPGMYTASTPRLASHVVVHLAGDVRRSRIWRGVEQAVDDNRAGQVERARVHRRFYGRRESSMS